MDEALVLYRKEDGVGIISMNRPEKHNAINNEMGPFMRVAWEQALGDKDVRSILLRGEGRSFSAGRDTKQLGTRDPGDSHFPFVRRSQDGRLAHMDQSKPVIAAVKGYCIGGGCETALAADIRVVARDAVFMLPEINYGILPDTGGTQLLTALVGPSRAKLMVMTGDRIDAQTAYEWGIADVLVEPEELDAKALALAKQIASKSPLAVAMAKQLVDNLWGERIRSGIRQELLAQVALFSSEDYQEARAALRERRAPEFKGR